MEPTPDRSHKSEPTYSPKSNEEEPPMPGKMPEDDFRPPVREGEAGGESAVKKDDPFKPGAGGAVESTPAAEPMPDDVVPENKTLHVLPVRQRTVVRAQYRVPRVARLQVAPQTEWQRVGEGRLARR
jgi:hypothetical protein